MLSGSPSIHNIWIQRKSTTAVLLVIVLVAKRNVFSLIIGSKIDLSLAKTSVDAYPHHRYPWKKFYHTTKKAQCIHLGVAETNQQSATSFSHFTVAPRNLYNVSKTFYGPKACSQVGIDTLGITGPKVIYRDLTYQELFDHEVANSEGDVVACKYGDETFMVKTGRFTGRSPRDKYFVRNPGSESEKLVNWGEINRPTSPEVYKELYEKAVQYFNTKDKIYVFDGFCGADPKTQKKVRFVHELAWQQHFVTNMFIRPTSERELNHFDPDFTVINCCSQVNQEWERLGLNSDVAVVFNIEEKTAVIFGTWYGGENKKGIFSLMNYWLPLANALPMHCSANVGKKGDSALFFGLSGTGKTTLSADPYRALIGDDEHGWDDDGIFNFEGGCYAKTVALSEEKEPDIFHAIKKDALLENVMLKPLNGKLVAVYDDISISENGRVSYPIFHMNNYHKAQKAGHPKNILFLACDAFGVLPPVSKLSSGQAMYHFLSGYTAKVAGTELGIREPQATFSACFGAAFMTLHPAVYGNLLAKKMEKHNAQAWLLNTGWTGGPYGIGERMSIHDTRACVSAILDGSALASSFEKDDIFGFDIPKSLPGVDPKVLNPKYSWGDPIAYEKAAKKLAQMYIENFHKYEKLGSGDYIRYGPHID